MIKTLTETKHKLKISNKLQEELLSDIDFESQVIVHFSFKSNSIYNGIRIWKSTYLIPIGFGERSKLVTVDKITMYPLFTYTPVGKILNFSLVFTGLPRNCKTFDLIEQIPEPGGFIYRNIKRNKTDVYSLKID